MPNNDPINYKNTMKSMPWKWKYHGVWYAEQGPPKQGDTARRLQTACFYIESNLLWHFLVKSVEGLEQKAKSEKRCHLL